MRQDGLNYAKYNSIWQQNPTIKYIGEKRNIN